MSTTDQSFASYDDSVMTPWERKAHKVIGELCLASFEATNRRPDGRFYKKHRPYAVPEVANVLVQCLGKRDEHRAKVVFMAILDGSHLDYVAGLE